MAERYEYTRFQLREEDLAASPFVQLQNWLEAAKQEPAILEPSAMCLSTAGLDSRPSSRMVLLRGCDEDGLTFFTNYESRKGEELLANPFACLNFWWGPLERQVRVEGRVEKVAATISDAYWLERPLESQLASAASPQSDSLPNREALEDMVARLRQEHPTGVPRPEHWGGYRLIPDRFEFWQGAPARLHDRLVYVLESGTWTIGRLAP